MTSLKQDSDLVNITIALNGIIAKRRTRQVMNNIKNFIPNRGTLASTDYTALVWLLSKWIIQEYENSTFDTVINTLV